jgi:transposase
MIEVASTSKHALQRLHATGHETVVMDNVRTHKVGGVRKAIEARGANVLYLPPYSPDFNPIEKPFSKIKSILERIAARTVETLETAVGEALQSFTPQERMNYFAASDYDAGCSDSALL